MSVCDIVRFGLVWVFALSVSTPGTLFGATEGEAASPVAAHEPGMLIPSVTTRIDPEHSYALYLPSTYEPTREWPVLFLFDARRRGAAMAERYIPMAEELGWIVVSSNNSQSDGDFEPNRRAMIAMWEDARERFSIHPKRSYASGFSGGGRIAVVLAFVRKGEVAGVIGWGAGFPPTHKPVTQRPPFAYVGTIGETDFNYYELVDLHTELESVGGRHWMAGFDGAHEWPPSAVAGAAMLWLEVDAMRTGLRPFDGDVAGRLLSQFEARAATYRDQGRVRLAALELEAAVRHLSGFADVSEAEDELDRLRELPEFAEQERRASEIKAGEEAYLAGVKSTFNRTASASEAPLTLPQVLAELDLPELKRRADDSGKPELQASAKRILARLGGQTGFLLPKWMIEQGDFGRALLMLEIAVEIQPENWWTWFSLARGAVRAGREKRAVEALGRAVELGLTDRSLLEDELFDPLRSRKAFRGLFDGLQG